MHIRKRNSKDDTIVSLTWQRNADKSLELQLQWKDPDGIVYRALIPLNSIKTIEYHETGVKQ
jgi:hypothetical protein